MVSAPPGVLVWGQDPQGAAYLDDDEALWVTGHAGELGDQLPKFGSALRVDHPACGGVRTG